MTALITQLPPEASYTNDPVYRISVETYHALIDVGNLTEDDPVELIEGVLVFKMPKKASHRICSDQLDHVISAVLPDGWSRQLQEPITLSDSEPEPDLAIYRGVSRDYPDSHPGPPNIALVVEVSDATLRLDRGSKLRVYARAAIPVYWIVNIVDRRIEVYSDPDPTAAEPSYRLTKNFAADERIVVVIDGKAAGDIMVEAILP